MKKIKLIPVLLLFCSGLYAQIGERIVTSNYHASLEAQGILTTSDHVPFWMRSNQFGSVPLAGASGSFIGAARKDYDNTKTRLVDWGASAEVRADLGTSARTTLIEGYAKLKVGIFELKAGRIKDINGLVDTSLSSGAFSVSGNALGIPKVQLSWPEFVPLPVFRHLFAVKGSFAHGWVGQQPLNEGSPIYIHEETYLHQLSFYGRLGRENWRLKLYGGFTHEVYWGFKRGDPAYKLSDVKTYMYAVVGKTYQGSKVGDHRGSVDLGLTYDFNNVRLTLYRLSIYDKGALSKLANIADGLNGISLLNTSGDQDQSGFKWHKLLFELFYTKDQAGYPSSKRTKSGDENYYNNSEYPLGWSYKGVGVGNPFITPATSTRAGLPNDPGDFFNNNRVVAFYGGMEGSFEKYQFTAKASYSFNYGTYGTSPWGHSRGTIFFGPGYGIWNEVKQFSAYLEVKRALNNGWEAGAVAAFDAGHLFYNSSGLILKLKKSF